MDQPLQSSRQGAGRGGGRGRGRGRGRGGRGRSNNRGRKRGGRSDFNSEPNSPNKRVETESNVHVAAIPTDETLSSSNQRTDQTFMTNVRFCDEASIHPQTIKALNAMKLSHMTEIQHKTLLATRETQGDVLGRAKTGTGKTVSFLLPSLQTILGLRPASPSSIRVLVISPTRELATQIYTQGQALIQYHNKLSIQVVFGGTNQATDVRKFNQKLPDILVATPGRLLDHLQNTNLHGGRTFSDAVNQLNVLVLDEADQLLEMGFRNDILSIIGHLQKNRQTLLFSATLPPALRKIMGSILKPNYVTIDCIHDADIQTHVHVDQVCILHLTVFHRIFYFSRSWFCSPSFQTHAVVPFDRVVISVLEVLRLAQNDPNHKIIVFFSTARLTGYFASLLTAMNISVVEIHSRKSQSVRNKASEKFRKLKSGVLLTSDVSARGVDYPNVTHVIQIGLPDNADQYVHRVGRTGRAGKIGKGYLILAEFERGFIKELKNVNVPESEELKALFAQPPSAETMQRFMDVDMNDEKLALAAEQAYQAWLGFYNSNTKRIGKISKTELVRLANEFAKLIGLEHQPALLKKTVGKMGLKGVPGLRTK